MKKNIFRLAILSLALLVAQLVALPHADAAPGDFLYLWGAQQHFQDPAGVALDGAGNVYVTDVDKIQVYNSSGIRIRKWGSYGSGEGQMKSPNKVAVDATGRVYVADTGNGRIDVFDTGGNFLGQWDHPDWQTNPPISVVSDGKGKVYVLGASVYDSAGNLLEGTIKLFDSEGNFLKQIGSPGPGIDQYTSASAIALDATGNVYVMSYGEFGTGVLGIQVFDAAGTFVRTAVGLYKFSVADLAVDSTGNIYVPGVAPMTGGAVRIFDNAGISLRQVVFDPYNGEHYWFPIGVAVDGKGNIYTVDDSDYGLRGFDSTGTLLSQWWTYGTGLGQLSRPTGIALDSSGKVYETDGAYPNPDAAFLNNRIQVFSGTGTPVAKWTGSFVQTSGVTVDSAGTIQVLDTGGASVLAHVFNALGNDTMQWGNPIVNGQYRNPYGIVQDKNGNFLITDQQFSTVLVYSSSGYPMTSFGTPGSGNGQLNTPKGIAVDAAGNIFVVDSGNGRVQVFDSAYKFVRKWGSPGFSNGYLRQPSGIAVDGNGNVFVADTGNNRIQVFNSTGTFLRKWGGEGDDDGQVRQPQGIAVDTSASKVYVADTGNNRIQVFQGYGGIDTTPPTVTAFAIPATSSSLTVPITTLTATDTVGVTGYLVNESATKPAASDPAWRADIPTSYTFASAGTKTLYAWAKDAAGNVSNSRSATVTVTVTGTLPPPWQTQDIGSVGLAGSASYTNGVFTVNGAGSDIFSTADAFRFVYQTMSGDGTIIARVSSLQNTNAYAKGGVMIRQSLAANSAHATMALTPVSGAEFLRRSATGGTTSSTARTGVAAPYWVRLVRTGSTFTGSVSSDGVTWVQVGTATVSMTGTVYIGLAVTSRNTGALCSATMDSVVAGDSIAPTVTAFSIPATSSSLTVPITTLTATDNVGVTGYLVNESATKPSASASGWSSTKPSSYTFNSTGTKTLYAWAKDAAGNVSNSRSATVSVSGGGLPSPWQTQDIGSVGLAGSASYASGVFNIKGAGADIFSTADAFRFVYNTMSGDGTIIARIASQQNTNYYAKTGVMIRQSLAAGSVHAMMSLSPGNGAQFLRRTATGGFTTGTTRTGIAAPYWVKLVRSGSTFTGSVSADGVSWVQVGSATVSMTGTVYVGLAVSSHNTSALCTVTMDSVTAPGVAVAAPKLATGKKK